MILGKESDLPHLLFFGGIHVEQVRNATKSDSLRNEMKHFNDTMKLKDDEIAFPRSHVHQLSDKLPNALPEFNEGEKEERKHWWKFW